MSHSDARRSNELPKQQQRSVTETERFPPAPEMVNRLKTAISGIGRNILGPGVENNMPVDHFVVTRDGEKVATDVTLDGEEEAIGRYSAPSKLGVYLSTLFHLAQGNPMLEELQIKPQQAFKLMANALQAFRNFQKDPARTHSKAGFVSWCEWSEDDSNVVPGAWGDHVFVPLLDNGEMKLPLEAIRGAFADSDNFQEREIVTLADEILGRMVYEQFVNPDASGRLYSKWNVNTNTKCGSDEPEYMWSEWAIPHLDAYLDRDTIYGPGSITKEAWTSLYSGTVTWDSPVGPLDVPKLDTWTLHEIWIIQYLGPLIMKSKLAPFYYNLIYYLTYMQRKNNNAGGLSTEYGHTGYNAAGPSLLHAEGDVADPDQSVPFGSIFEGLVYPPAIMWADRLFDERWANSRRDGTGRVIKKYGPVTSLRRGNIKPELGAGPSRFHTWDNTGGTANGLAEWYLMTHLVEAEKYTSLSQGYVRAKARKWNVSYEEAEAAIIKAFDEVAQVIEARWQADPKTLSNSVRGPENKRESYQAQVISRNQIRARYHLSEDEKGLIMAVDPSEILLPPEEPDFRIYEKPWPNTLVADDLNIADYLNRSERHEQSMLEPDKSFDDSWKADEKSKWLLKDGEIIASYFIKKSKTPALLATYLAPEVPLAVKNVDGLVKKYQSISLWVNVDGFKGGKFTMRLDSHSLTIAITECDPDAEGQLSPDKKWKRLVMPFANDRIETTIKEEEYFNKMKIVVKGTAGLAGTIHVKGVQLHVATADEVSKRVVGAPPGKSAPLKRV
ncbi:MAG TPA: hypothetical protein VFH31_11655 [Pyrinomonadaceae bacterium]|nr:hypothetical protein [Pyrinomonadaceae bacterium]